MTLYSFDWLHFYLQLELFTIPITNCPSLDCYRQTTKEIQGSVKKIYKNRMQRFSIAFLFPSLTHKKRVRFRLKSGTTGGPRQIRGLGRHDMTRNDELMMWKLWKGSQVRALRPSGSYEKKIKRSGPVLYIRIWFIEVYIYKYLSNRYAVTTPTTLLDSMKILHHFVNANWYWYWLHHKPIYLEVPLFQIEKNPPFNQSTIFFLSVWQPRKPKCALDCIFLFRQKNVDNRKTVCPAWISDNVRM